MQKITPFLWFDTQAEEAARFYTSIFPKSKINLVTRRGENEPGPAGSVMTVSFELEGQEFMSLNGGPVFHFTEAISFIINCETQAEVDEYWEKLSAGGEKGQCGWLKDKYGVSWQVVPTIMEKLMTGADPAKANRMMQAMLKMTKLVIAELQQAYDQE